MINQQDYKGIKFGSKKKSDISLFGCKLCCLAWMVNKNPQETDEILVNGNAYFGKDGDMILDSAAAKALGIEFYGREYDINKEPKWSPTIKEVDFSIKDGKQQHFVIRMVEGKDRYILDPWGGIKRKINYYELKTKNPLWKKKGFSYRLFKNNEIKTMES